VIEISSRPWPSGSAERPRRRPAPRGFPRPGHGGVVPAGPGRHTVAGSPICSGCPAPAGRPGCCKATRDPLAGNGDHSPERGIEHPFAPVDFLAHVQDQRRELGCVARLDPGAECGQAAHERAAPAHGRPRGHLGIPRHLSASRRPSGQAGPEGSASVRSVLPGIRAGLACWSWRLVRAMAAQAIASSRSMTAVRRSARCRLQELARGPDTDPSGTWVPRVGSARRLKGFGEPPEPPQFRDTVPGPHGNPID